MGKVSVETLRKLRSSNFTNVPKQKGSPLWLAHILGAFWRLKSLPCSFPDKGRASRHEDIPQSSVCSGEMDDVTGTEMRENLIDSIRKERIVIVRGSFFFYLEKDVHRHDWEQAETGIFRRGSLSRPFFRLLGGRRFALLPRLRKRVVKKEQKKMNFRNTFSHTISVVAVLVWKFFFAKLAVVI